MEYVLVAIAIYYTLAFFVLWAMDVYWRSISKNAEELLDWVFKEWWSPPLVMTLWPVLLWLWWMAECKHTQETIAMMTKWRDESPSAGEKWRFVPESDPFGGKPSWDVTILDVREGWVRYDMGGTFRDERMPVDRFVSIYKRIG